VDLQGGIDNSVTQEHVETVLLLEKRSNIKCTEMR